MTEERHTRPGLARGLGQGLRHRLIFHVVQVPVGGENTDAPDRADQRAAEPGAQIAVPAHRVEGERGEARLHGGEIPLPVAEEITQRGILLRIGRAHV